MKLRVLVPAFAVLCLSALLGAAVSSAQPVPQVAEAEPPRRSAHVAAPAGGKRTVVRGRLDAGTVEASSVLTGGIELTVVNQHNQPAANARVEWFRPGALWTTGDGTTDSAGRFTIPVPDGPWRVVVSSPDDGFLTVREGVLAPGSATIAPTDTVPVEVSAVLPSGAPLGDGNIFMEPFVDRGDLGWANEAGRRTVLVQPRAYAMLVVDWSRLMYLSQRAVTITSATTLVFDARQMPTATVVFIHPGIDELRVDPWPQPPCRSWAPLLQIPDGGRLIVTADRYDLSLNRTLWRDSVQWDYRLAVPGWPLDIDAGSTTTVTVGTTLAATMTTNLASYPPGAQVMALAIAADSYGNSLQNVSVGRQPLLAHMILRNPQGVIADEKESYFSFWVPGFNIPANAMNGLWKIEWSLDTGPWQGVLRAQTTFRVEGQAVPTRTPTPTRTTTPTPTPTRGPTVTPAVTGPWHVWLPVIRRGAW